MLNLLVSSDNGYLPIYFELCVYLFRIHGGVLYHDEKKKKKYLNSLKAMTSRPSGWYPTKEKDLLSKATFQGLHSTANKKGHGSAFPNNNKVRSI